jgi:Polyketide cyclase / dehydrase and lipid transport
LSRHTLSLLCLLLIAGAPLGRPDDGPALSADTGWQRLDDKSGVALYSRARLGSAVKEFKGTGIIDAPPATVEKVLADVSSYPSFMPYVTESRAVSQTGVDVITYQRLNVPFVANRDYTVRVEHGLIKAADGGTIYRDEWQTDNEAGPAERRGIVRVKVNEGSWVLEPSGPGGNSTQATYQIYTDSGGALPAFLANRASQMIIPRLFEAIRKQARDGKYGR